MNASKEEILVAYYSKKYDGLPETFIRRQAQNTAAKISEKCEWYLEKYGEGTELDFSCGEFSLFDIMKGTGCDYVTALVLLSDYIRDPVVGKRNILFYR